MSIWLVVLVLAGDLVLWPRRLSLQLPAMPAGQSWRKDPRLVLVVCAGLRATWTQKSHRPSMHLCSASSTIACPGAAITNPHILLALLAIHNARRVPGLRALQTTAVMHRSNDMR